MVEQFTSYGLVRHFYNIQDAMERQWKEDHTPGWNYTKAQKAAYVAYHYCVRINGYAPPEQDSFAGLMLKAAASILPSEAPSRLWMPARAMLEAHTEGTVNGKAASTT